MADDLLSSYRAKRPRDPAPQPAGEAAIRDALEQLKAPRRKVTASDVGMMLAEVRDGPFTREGWLFEIKLDGYRLMAGSEKGKPSLISRNGLDLAGSFPEISRAVAALPFSNIVIDGEVVALTPEGRPSFQLLQQARTAAELPVIYYAFDLPGFAGYDLRGLPLLVRKELLRRVIPTAGPVRYLEHFETEGESLYQHVVKLGLEGVVAKRTDAPYKAGRSPLWNKIRADRSDDFVVVGYTPPKGARGGFGALHLAQYVDGNLVYSGRAGSGFSGKQLQEVKADLDRIQRKSPPCDGPVPFGETSGAIPITAIPDYRISTWVEPRLVAEVRFKEWTQEGYLRHPVFLRFREDKPPLECVRQGTPAVARPTVKPTLKGSAVQVTNRDKVFWPEDGYTKGDLIEYYRAIAPWLLPYLHDRPVVLTRYPDGIAGKNFFQKDAPGHVPAWLRTVRLWSEQAQRDIDYFVCENEDGLVYLANLASIPLHIWASRVETLALPDWCSLDLDPKGAPFGDVITLARSARELCERIGLPAFIKTTGSSGLHVMIPLGRQFTHDQAKTLGEVLAHALVKKHRAIATTTRAVQKREGKVYVDYGQNGHGKLLVAPFSVRALPGAPVSMPLKWTEVKAGLDIRGFTIKNAIARMKKLKQDPLLPIMQIEPDLESALDALQREM
ncbi:MAG TPA: DNA ligase D [Gemmatimonadales bacterium]|nr:DNA ligase D [Gemmatimonadales bacterium]